MLPNKIVIMDGEIHRTEKTYINDIEYIRKDALLEWLQKEYETMAWYYEKMKHVTGCVGDTSSSGKAEAYKEVIEKIESL